MWWGWEKTVRNNYLKMGLSKEHQASLLQYNNPRVGDLRGFVDSNARTPVPL